MNKQSEDLGPALRKMCRQIEQRHDLRTDFFGSLVGQNDWAFVIQSHALIEAALGDALTARTGDRRLRGIFDRMPLTDVSGGKLGFARAYELLDTPQMKYVQFHSELRNQLVHKIGNVNFSLADHLAAMDQNQFKAWCNRITAVATEGSRPGLSSIAREQPKVAIWFATVLIVHHVLPDED